MKLETVPLFKITPVLASIINAPPNFFTISMGLAALAGCWRLVGDLNEWAIFLSNILFGLAAIIYLILAVSMLVRLVLNLQEVKSDLYHPVTGPFVALLPINGMLLCFGLQPYLAELARILFIIFFLATLLTGAVLTGQWIIQNLSIEKFHPGYFLPTVAGGFVGADGTARFGFMGLGWLSFGIGLICWLTLGSIILNRLLFSTPLPTVLVPSLAIELAPPVVGGNAYFSLNGGKIDSVVYLLAGYAIFMGLVQLRFLPNYLKLKFGIGWWTFTFTYAASASFTLRWIKYNQIAGADWLSYLILGAISLFIGGIGLCSLNLLYQSLFRPGPLDTPKN